MGAFAPASTGKASTALSAFESELGVQPPLGFFDPLGLLDDADQDRFDRLRYVEIKHGRMGTRAGVHLPGPIDLAGTSFDSFPNGWAAINGPDAISGSGLGQIIFFIGTLELGVMKDSANGAAPGDFPGDFRNGALDFGWDTFDAETQDFKRGVELNNGRAAMMGILGLMVHEQLGGELPIVGPM